MRARGTWLIVIGATDIAVAVAAFFMHAMAFASQYTGLVHWLTTQGAAVESGSVEYERIRVGVLEMLNRTSGVFVVVAALLFVNGIILLTVGVRKRMLAGQGL